MKDTRIVDIDLVEPNPYQPRLEFDDEALMDLAQSIRENGLIQPITVREMDGKYRLLPRAAISGIEAEWCCGCSCSHHGCL
ncbi:MAG: ParB N-terminal domain-containing protein [Clostridium sp.]